MTEVRRSGGGGSGVQQEDNGEERRRESGEDQQVWSPFFFLDLDANSGELPTVKGCERTGAKGKEVSGWTLHFQVIDAYPN
uniref:Uncharacterized protein n=1 Tax=Leersia perrieri TaxID=77586 RepID=A0A0D9V1L1_9ORYZ